MPESTCDLCADTGPVYLHARCHLSAPLSARLEPDGTLILACYVPDCRREIARFRVVDAKPRPPSSSPPAPIPRRSG